MTAMTRIWLWAVAVAVGAGGFVAPAAAQQNHKIDTLRFELHGNVGWYGGLGLGGSIEIPVVSDGVVSEVEDEMVLGIGGDFLFVHLGHHDHDHDHGHNDVVFVGQLVWQWNFYVSDEWSVFPELGFGLWFGNQAHRHHHHDEGNDDHSHVFAEFVGSLGARWHFGDNNALLMKLTWPVGAQLGITFDV
ncbi:MAG: hypothetical protein AAGF12_08835 [Myxococcota bacterium]